MHRVYRTLDEAPSFIQGMEVEDFVVAALAFAFWNAVISSLIHIRLVAILYVPLLGGSVVATLFLWLRLKSRMPRFFIRDAIEYLRQGELYEVGPDIEMVPMFIGHEEDESVTSGWFGEIAVAREAVPAQRARAEV